MDHLSVAHHIRALTTEGKSNEKNQTMNQSAKSIIVPVASHPANESSSYNHSHRKLHAKQCVKSFKIPYCQLRLSLIQMSQLQMISQIYLRRDGPLFFWRGGQTFRQRKQFFWVLLLLQTIFLRLLPSENNFFVHLIAVDFIIN